MLFGLCQLSWTSDSYWESQKRGLALFPLLCWSFLSLIYLNWGSWGLYLESEEEKNWVIWTAWKTLLDMGLVLRLPKSLGWDHLLLIRQLFAWRTGFIVFWIILKVWNKRSPLQPGGSTLRWVLCLGVLREQCPQTFFQWRLPIRHLVRCLLPSLFTQSLDFA